MMTSDAVADRDEAQQPPDLEHLRRDVLVAIRLGNPGFAIPITVNARWLLWLIDRAVAPDDDCCD
jgi:hypothetical protein